jgi:hypothetical protein
VTSNCKLAYSYYQNISKYLALTTPASLWSFGPKRIGANVLINRVPHFSTSPAFQPIIQHLRLNLSADLSDSKKKDKRKGKEKKEKEKDKEKKPGEAV